MGNRVTISQNGATVVTVNTPGPRGPAGPSGLIGPSGSAFPFTGSAEITGSLILTGSLSVSGSGIAVDLLGDVTIDQNIEISNRDQSDDIAIGYQALPDTTYIRFDGVTRRAIAIGYQAAANLTSGSENIYIGQCAGYSSVKTACNTGIGFCALACNTGLDLGDEFNFSQNTAIGANALKSLTTGLNNTAVGAMSNCSLTIGTGNTTVGTNTGAILTSGSRNTFLGDVSGIRVTTENDNTFVGAQAGQYARGSCNTALGASAFAGGSLGPTGECNVAIGHKAGTFPQGDSNNNIYIGPNSGPATGIVQNCQLYIGVNQGETPLIRGDFGTGELTINSCLKVTQASGSFIGDGSGLTGLNSFPHTGSATVSGSLNVTGSYYVTGSVSMNALIDLAHVSQSLDFPGDAEAAAGGVPLGGVYRSGNVLAIRIE